MSKTIIGILVLLILALSAALWRSQERERRLEERLASAEAHRPAARPAPEPLSAPLIAEAPAAPVRPAAPSEPPPSSAKASPPVPPDAPVKIVPTSGTMTWTVARPADSFQSQLHLTDAQKKAISDLRKNAEQQTRTYSEQLAKVEAQTEEAVRRLLDPQQLQAYDAMKRMHADVQIFTPTEEDPALSSGRRPGYLGINGTDAEGGGVTVGGVLPGTVAGASGLQPGDVILEVNGEKVSSFGDLAAKVRQNGEGGPVTLRIRRGTSEFYQGMQLGPRPP